MVISGGGECGERIEVVVVMKCGGVDDECVCEWGW